MESLRWVNTESYVHFRKANTEPFMHFRKVNTVMSMHFRKANTGIYISFTPSFSQFTPSFRSNVTLNLTSNFTLSFNPNITTNLLHHNLFNLLQRNSKLVHDTPLCFIHISYSSQPIEPAGQDQHLRMIAPLQNPVIYAIFDKFRKIIKVSYLK